MRKADCPNRVAGFAVIKSRPKAADRNSMKQEKKRTGGRLLWVLAILLVAVPAVLLLRIFLQYRGARQEYAQLAQRYTTAESAVPGQPGETLLQIDWEQLAAENPEVIGWITMDGIDLLDYPIVQAADNGYYLNHSYTGAYRPAGAIFMECQNSAAFTDLHTIVYGHNVKDGSMFGSLTRFREEDFYRQAGGSFTLYTPAGAWRYTIFSVENVQVNDPGVYAIGYRQGEEYAAFLHAMKDRSLYDTGVQVDGNDYVITLSTCVSGTSQTTERFVVHAKCMEQLQ